MALVTLDGGAELSTIGVVVIGRNEGERLRRCLMSLLGMSHRVYVDSGSTDGSQDLARRLGFEVEEITTPPGFTAARARNAGLKLLLELAPDLAFVQMVDGDCEVVPEWLPAARAALEADPRLAVVFGRRRERFPSATVYNWMCDDEWNVPVGEVRSCGGDALFRVAPLVEVGGYTDTFIAGEEPDLCLRLRQRGWTIRRIADEMTVHDAALHRFGQWWRRAQRAGHAFAELTHRHGQAGDPTWRRQLGSTLAWAGIGGGGFLALFSGVFLRHPVLLAVGGIGLALFGLQGLRIARKRMQEGVGLGQALPWAALIMIAKFAELTGVLQFHGKRLAGRSPTLIEYKA